MAVVGSLQLLAIGFDTDEGLPPTVLHRLQWLCPSKGIRLLDALHVSKSDDGILKAAENAGLNVISTPPGAILRSFFEDPDPNSPALDELEWRSAGEVGLDLEAVEEFADRIAPGTSALLILAEPGWATEFLDVVLPSGGFPLVIGYLEPETMLLIGPQVAEAVRAAEARRPAPAATDRPDGPSRNRRVPGNGRHTPVARMRSATGRNEAPLTPLHPSTPNGNLSLEIRWIIPGVLTPEMIDWFGPPATRSETRRDSYLLDRTQPGLGVKLRGGSQLDVKVGGGDPAVLTVPGRAQGRLGQWRKWSFPIRAADRAREPAGWTTVEKRRRLRFFSLDGRPTWSRLDAAAGGGCVVELTGVIVHGRPWWTLGFEARGPGGRLENELTNSLGFILDDPLPAGTILDMAHSTSYPEWLALNWPDGLGSP